VVENAVSGHTMESECVFMCVVRREKGRLKVVSPQIIIDYFVIISYTVANLNQIR
jgi:hypothetical protein